MELVDTQDLKSCEHCARAGSSPAPGTKNRVSFRARAKNSLCFFLHTHTRAHTSIMFDFEKLSVYSKAKTFNAIDRKFIKDNQLDPTTKDQFRRASFSVVLNIAEGSGRFSKPDRRNFFVIARSSIFECIAVIDVLKDENAIEEQLFNDIYQKGEELSKMLFAMIKNLEKLPFLFYTLPFFLGVKQRCVKFFF